MSITWYILGLAPECYWILMTVKCYFYLALMWRHRVVKKPTQLLFMAEFCWVACHCYMVYLTCALLVACGVKWEWLRQVTHQRYAFYVFWGIANGPFAFATLVFKNALVLHDIPNLASAFIHLTPSSLVWTLRWWQPAVQKRFPDVFDIPDFSGTETFLELFLPPYIFYMAWAVLYLIWMIVIGRHHGLPHTEKYDTVFHETMRGQPWLHNIIGYDDSTPEKRIKILPIVKFQICQCLAIAITMAFGYLLWWNFWVHTAWCAVLFSSCTYFGAVRYFNMMTKYYMKSLEKIVREHTQDQEEKRTIELT